MKLLVSQFNINIDQEGVVKFDGHKVIGATALWCAAGNLVNIEDHLRN